MSSCQCQGIETQFDKTFAERELKRYRRKGVRKTTRILLDALQDGSIENMTLLDVGGGVGGIQLEMLRSGLKHATSVDASAAYQEAAREEAARQGVEDRIDFLYGDFVEHAGEIAEADIVTLDRVICCYDDMPALVSASARHARKRYGLVYPRRAWWTRAGVAGANLWLRMRRCPMRTFLHPPADVDHLLQREGLQRRSRSTTMVWHVDVYER